MDVSDRRGQRSAPLSLDDCRCSVCLEIFIEPVTLPCSHTFCKACFLETVDKAALCCPMCRKRVSTWARVNSRNKTLVDEQLWRRIQNRFPRQCERRLAGQEDEDDPGMSVCSPTVSRPGELRQEYEDQVTKLTEEKRLMEEEELRASELYIQRLLSEEQQLLQDERRRREEDERVARLLSNQLNSAAVPQEVTPAPRKEVVISGLIDRFFCPRPTKASALDCSSASSVTDNKENVVVMETRPQVHQSQLIADGRSPATKRKISETTTEEEIAKQARPSSSCVAAEPPSQQGAALWEAELLSRRRQEDDDRRIALLLQKELDHEEKQRSTDRRKGSVDAYLLRQNQGKEEVRTDAPSPASSSPASSSSTASSSPSTHSSSSSGRRQTTLTEMFS